MSIHCPSFLSIFGLLLVLVTFLLQLVALTTTWWAIFTARIDLGKPKEEGHYGLWTICSTKGPHWTEDCDPMDTFFQVPAYSNVSGIIGIIHLLFLLSLLPLGSLRAVQVIRNVSNFGMTSKTLCIAKVSVAFISVIFSILVAIFSSVGENRSNEYTIVKGWSFWTQIAVIVADIVITMVCAIENFQFWKQQIREHFDPDGVRAETYGNPTFDSGSPESARRHHHANGSIAYTESSGEPYNTIIYDEHPKPYPKKSNLKRSEDFSQSKVRRDNRDLDESLNYENYSYQEQSPPPRRPRRKEHYYYQ